MASKQGDFTEFLNLGSQLATDALGRPVFQGAIYDPLTTRPVYVGQVDPDTGLTAAADAMIRDQFPGNRIPSNRFDRVAKNILPLFPDPTRPGLRENYLSQAATINQVNQWGTKIDHQFTGNHKISGSFVWSRLSSPGISDYTGPLTRAIPNTNAFGYFA